MMEANLLVDAVIGGGLADVIQNPRPVGDRLRLGPRPERIAQREHVGVGSHAGIAKQIPGAADAIAALEDSVGFARAFLLQMIARPDAGEAGADDQDVEVFGLMWRFPRGFRSENTFIHGPDPPAGPKPLRRGVGPPIHVLQEMDGQVKPGAV